MGGDPERESSRTGTETHWIRPGPSRKEGATAPGLGPGELPDLVRAFPARGAPGAAPGLAGMRKKLTAYCWRDKLIVGSGPITLIARTLYPSQAGIIDYCIYENYRGMLATYAGVMQVLLSTSDGHTRAPSSCETVAADGITSWSGAG